MINITLFSKIIVYIQRLFAFYIKDLFFYPANSFQSHYDRRDNQKGGLILYHIPFPGLLSVFALQQTVISRALVYLRHGINSLRQ